MRSHCSPTDSTRFLQDVVHQAFGSIYSSSRQQRPPARDSVHLQDSVSPLLTGKDVHPRMLCSHSQCRPDTQVTDLIIDVTSPALGSLSGICLPANPPAHHRSDHARSHHKDADVLTAVGRELLHAVHVSS